VTSREEWTAMFVAGDRNAPARIVAVLDGREWEATSEQWVGGGTHRAGVVEIRGMIARGPTIRSLVRQGLAECGGHCAEVDGDGFTKADDAPWYAITATGREALVTLTEGDVS
jgi:hypothetical protein